MIIRFIIKNDLNENRDYEFSRKFWDLPFMFYSKFWMMRDAWKSLEIKF